MHKKLLLCVCAAAAAVTFGCNESVEWKPAQLKAECGNGIVEAGEACDTVTSLTCADFDSSKTWVSGNPICSSSCLLAKGTCVEQSITPSSTCNNGQLEAGEACDGNQIADPELTCAALKGEGATGSLKCTSDCKVDASECVASTNCGNGNIDDGEICDGNNFGDATCQSLVENAIGGSLACVSCSSIDTTGCELPPAEPECGNGLVEDGEDCDGENFADGMVVDCGEGKALDVRKCNDQCAIDLEASCKAIPDGCGDGEQTEGEECDVNDEGIVSVFTNEAFCAEGFQTKENVICDPFCKIDREASCEEIPQNLCGNGIIDDGEACDLTVFPEDFVVPECEEGKALAALTCKDDCSGLDMDATCLTIPDGCGDGQQTEEEECDVDADGNVITFVEDFCGEDQVAKAEIACNDFCKIDRVLSCEASAPAAECGNGIVEDGEVCDTNAFPEDFDFPACEEGKAYDVKTCLSDCSGLDLEASCKDIPADCGNGEMNDEEECDIDGEGNVYVFTNEAFCAEGFQTKEDIVCNEFCKIDREASCEEIAPTAVCGNGLLEVGEDCDFDEEGKPIHLLGASCATVLENPDATGALGCSTDCKVDTSLCEVPVDLCGNGELDEGEICDGEHFIDGLEPVICEDGFHFDHHVCTLDCTIDESASCAEDIPENCGNNIIDAGEICDSSMPKYTPMACLYDPSVADDEHVLKDNDNFWIPAASLMCSASCRLDTQSACIKYEINDIQTELAAEVVMAAGQDFKKIAAYGVSLSDGMVSEYNSTNGIAATKFGPWNNAGGDDGTFNTKNYVQYSFRKRHDTIVNDYDYVSVFFTYRRDNSKSPARYAVALYDGEEYVGLVANFSINNFTGWAYSGELVISIKDLTDPIIRIHNYDAGSGSVYIKNLTVTGINFKSGDDE